MSYSEELERTGLEIREDLESYIDSEYGVLGRAAYESIPVAIGASASGIGRATGTPELAALPPAGDFLSGGLAPRTTEGLMVKAYDYAKYAAGVALPYVDKIAMAADQIYDKI